MNKKENMIQRVCDILNEYHYQFRKGIIENPINIRPMKWDDELLNDIIVFYSENDKNTFNDLKGLMNDLNKETSELVINQNFEKAKGIREQKAEIVNRMGVLIYRGRFNSNKIFSLTKDGVIVYTEKHLMNGELTKKFLELV